MEKNPTHEDSMLSSRQWLFLETTPEERGIHIGWVALFIKRGSQSLREAEYFDVVLPREDGAITNISRVYIDRRLRKYAKGIKKEARD